MRLIWLAFLISILLYVYIGDTMAGISWLTFSNGGKSFILLSALGLLSFVLFRKKRYSAALEFAKQQPENIHAVRGWMNSWIVLLSIAESEALFGLCFRMGNKTLQQSLPFYAVGFLLTLSLWPRRISE
jgi:hypothetical protein